MEVTILRYSEVFNENATCRIDAEYFRKEYLHALRLVEGKRYSYIGDITSWVTQGPNPSFSEIGTPCLTGRNINKGEVSYENPDYVDDDEYKKLSRYKLKMGDTLITLKGKGSIGKVGFVSQDRRAIFSRDIGIVRPSSINAGYLNVFILCKFGKLLVDRGETGGTGQSTLTTSYLKAIPIPRFNFEGDIGKLLDQIEKLKEKSQAKYKEAETLLLVELGLTDWRPKHRLSFINNYFNVQQAERTDAEYFQPKYDEIVNAIKTYKGGWDMMNNLVKIKDKNFSPRDDVVYNYIELADIGSNGEITGCTEAFGKELPTRARRIVSTGDVIVSSIEGSLSSIALITQEFNKALSSTGFYVINSEFYNSETLLCLLRSSAGQMQLKKGCTGTILTAINKDEFSRIILPKISDQIQKTIKDNILSAYKSKIKSKQLLEIAKQGIEMAIERNEEIAEEWIKIQVENLDINPNDEE